MSDSVKIFTHNNLKKILSSPSTKICKNAFSISSTNTIRWIRNFRIISNIFGFKILGPANKQLFNEFAVLHLLEASNTVLTRVLDLSCLITGLWACSTYQFRLHLRGLFSQKKFPFSEEEAYLLSPLPTVKWVESEGRSVSFYDFCSAGGNSP